MSFAGGDQPGNVTDLPDEDDGEADLDGPAAPGRGHDGGEDHEGDRRLPTVAAQDGGVRLPQGHLHGLLGR